LGNAFYLCHPGYKEESGPLTAAEEEETETGQREGMKRGSKMSIKGIDTLLSLNSIIWYCPTGHDALWQGR